MSKRIIFGGICVGLPALWWVKEVSYTYDKVTKEGFEYPHDVHDVRVYYKPKYAWSIVRLSNSEILQPAVMKVTDKKI